MHQTRRGYGSVLLTVFIVTVTFLSVAGLNRLPILFPDTMGYNSAGEAVLTVLAGGNRLSRHQPQLGESPSPSPPSDGVSESRSPFYGVALALANRVGGVWFSAALQSVAVAVALVLAVRRLGIGLFTGAATIALVASGGLAFYSVVLIPDVFLGLVILALAFLITAKRMARFEASYWTVLLFSGLVFHRGFVAVSLIIVLCAVAAWNSCWFSRRGWRIAATATGFALLAHAAVAPVVERVYAGKLASPPFLLARMAEGGVLPAYLADACPIKPYFLCTLRSRLPMDHDKFLWALGSDGVFNQMTTPDRQRIIAEADTLVAHAVLARPLASIVEAARYFIRVLFFAGMDDFAQRVPVRWRVDPSLQLAMIAYPKSGIVNGDFPLHAVSLLTESIYLVSLLIVAGSAMILGKPVLIGRRRTRAVDKKLIASVVIILAGIIVNAGVSGILSGVRDRYTGRVAWLASLVAVASVCHVFAVTRSRSLVTREEEIAGSQSKIE